MDSKIQQIERLIAEAQDYTFETFSDAIVRETGYGGNESAAWLAWRTRVPFVINQLADKGSAQVKLCAQADLLLTKGYERAKFERKKQMYLLALEQTLAFLKDDVFGEAAGSKAAPMAAKLSNRIFVVHGHDEQLKVETELFLTNLGLEPVVLHRQPDEGKTIIEKFEKHADVGFAFVLFTPDEIAYTVDQLLVPETARKKEYRARPNVIFEFGFFVGKLGRGRVCGLLRGTVTRPSDMDGLIYKDASKGIEPIAWNLIQELKAARYDIKV
jgi:predicted nucleotide-binding protein